MSGVVAYVESVMQLFSSEDVIGRSRQQQVYGLLLEHGKLFTKSEVDHESTQGWLESDQVQFYYKSCFLNAQLLLLHLPVRFQYHEGFANMVGIPMHHAWCVDTWTGMVIDPTWQMIDDGDVNEDEYGPLEYFGIEIPIEYIIDQWRSGRAGNDYLWDYIIDHMIDQEKGSHV